MVKASPSKTNIITLQSASSSLGLKPADLNKLIVELKITRVKNTKGKWALDFQDFTTIKTLVTERRKNKQPVTESNKPKLNASEIKKIIKANVNADPRPRKVTLRNSTLYVGPTNSGKTYHGLQQLFSDFREQPELTHVYAAPLRLLAYEVYLKMAEEFGEDKVGFITGEESINPTASLLATTAEMAPLEGHSLLVDEAHWLTDPDRGSVWTRLLYSANFSNIYSLTAAEAVPLVEALTSDAWNTEIKRFERKTAVEYGGILPLNKIPKRTAVVCFSRKRVYQVAAELLAAGYKVGVLYGNLPLKVRKNQIKQYLDNKFDVMVVTDVIGHGINLPIDNVVFAETYKFDGKVSRPLYIWEGAQIAGRAGRFGLSEKGTVYLANGLPWFTADKDAVKDFVLAAGGKIETDLVATEAYYAPKFSDLGMNSADGTLKASLMFITVDMWEGKGLDLQEDALYPSQMLDFKTNYGQITNALRLPAYPWEEPEKHDDIDERHVQELWQLGDGPFEPSMLTLSTLSKWVVDPNRDESHMLVKFFEANVLTPISLSRQKIGNNLPTIMEQLEVASLINGELKMAMLMFGVQRDKGRYLGYLSEHALLDAQEEITDFISKKLLENVRRMPTFSKKTSLDT